MKLRVSGKSTQGFTLVELMVVVAIAGAIIVMAVPQYCKYSSVSKQAQAKSLLASIWVAEQSFSIQAGSYTACLNEIGVNATAATPLQYYGFGFNPGSSANNACGTSSNQSCLLTDFSGAGVNCPVADTAYQAAVNMDSINTTKPAGPQLVPLQVPAPANTVTNNTFFAMAVGNISSCNSAYDRWTIDQTKSLVNDTISL